MNEGPGEHRDLVFLSLREEPIGNSALIEDFDAAREQTACARAGEVLAGAPFDNGNVDPGQRQFTRQHQPRRACAHDQDIGIPHGHQTAPVVRNGGLPPARVPTEEMSTRVFLKGFHKAEDRSFAILELLQFGSISTSGGPYVYLASAHSWPCMRPERPAPGALYRSDNAEIGRMVFPHQRTNATGHFRLIRPVLPATKNVTRCIGRISDDFVISARGLG